MRFIIGEDLWTMLERASYRGSIGLFYNSTLGGILSYIIFGIIILLAVIGLFTVLKVVFGIGHRDSIKSKSGLSKQEQQWLFGKK